MQNNIQENKLLAYVRENKKLVFLTVGVSLMFLLIISTIVTMNTQANPTPVKPSITPSPLVSDIPTRIPTTRILPTKTLNQQENSNLLRDTQEELDKRIDIQYSVSAVKGYGYEWAIFQVENPSTDPAKVIAKKENGTWVIKLGPGTDFEQSQLQRIGAPQNLINELYK